MYFDEDMLLDIRLNILNNYVDKFVIAEATIDHGGKERTPQFDINKFLKFKSKIKYILIKDLPTHNRYYKKNWGPSWRRENLQRNSLEQGYRDCDPNDIVMISDLDEIPNPKKIKEFNIKNKYACFIQKNLHQKMNLLNITVKDWAGTKICQKKYLKSPQWLRNIKIKKRPFWKFYKPKEPQIITEGGWHFNDLKKPEDISKKFKSGAHQEENIEEFTNLEKINKRMKDYKDLLGREYKYEVIKIDEAYPEYILDNKNKYKEWIL